MKDNTPLCHKNYKCDKHYYPFLLVNKISLKQFYNFFNFVCSNLGIDMYTLQLFHTPHIVDLLLNYLRYRHDHVTLPLIINL